MALWHVEQITARFLIIAMSVSAVLAALVSGAVAWRQFEGERHRLSSAMQDVARLNAIALQEPMWSINDRATAAIVHSLAANPSLSCAEVTDSRGRLLAATAAAGCDAPVDSTPFAADVDYEGHHLGRLTLWVDRSALTAAARADAQLTALVFLLLSAAMVISSVFALRATVMAPLDRLNRAIATAAKVETNPRPRDELGRVVTAYNGLLDRIDAHNAELEDARTQAVAAAQAKSRFLATMSHEIRTPMHGVLGTVELLRETPLTLEQRKYADVIWQSTESLLGIINDILDLSRIEAGKVRITPAPTNPAAIVREVAGALDATARAKGLRLDLVTAPDLPEWILADALRLRQVVMNLVGNAVKFTETGTVSVSLGRHGERLEITVADTGIGIATSELARLFEPFRQADTSTTRRHGGTGLGLSISRQLVDLMGGRIDATSTLGTGSTFRVLLPLIETSTPTAATARPRHDPASATIDAGRVLAAEDNPVNQWLLRSQLERLGYEVEIHSNGALALDAFRKGTEFAAVVTDYHMPVMDGLDLARAIRATEAPNQRVPIIGMTADAFADTVEECLKAGMDTVVTKPVSLQDMASALSLRAGTTRTTSPCHPGPPPSFTEAPLLDAEILAAVCGPDPATRADMAALFSATADDLRRAITASLAAGDSRELSEAAHSLASAALSLGATRLGLTGRALEQAAKAEDWLKIRPLAARLAALDIETRAALNAPLDETEVSDGLRSNA
ncbi:ATP-binding protein [Magnetospirillum aberrantis]|uniref:histidine kinase n=1 Tax=Magnetospirillum aberrantis SpK TaxID=908842 RepID=A0A7C9QV67_9PROT|nr:response regulator [Magnetospirillum aberrantis SpK]